MLTRKTVIETAEGMVHVMINFCFVVFGDEENCLDPEAPYKIYSPNVATNTGETVTLRIFSNKPDEDISYTWSVKERMPGSQDVIREPYWCYT